MTKETSTTGENNEISYSLALEELQEIINDLESDQVDIDELARKVERANETMNCPFAGLISAKSKSPETINLFSVNKLPEKIIM